MPSLPRVIGLTLGSTYIVALTGAALLNVVLLTLLIRVARRPARGDLVARA